MAGNIMDVFKSTITREDFDHIIKAFYEEAYHASADMEEVEKKGFQEACKVFDKVISSYKKIA